MPSPTYHILAQTPMPNGQTRYHVRFESASGYTEEQDYVGDLSTLAAAQEHFNTTVTAREETEQSTPPSTE